MSHVKVTYIILGYKNIVSVDLLCRVVFLLKSSSIVFTLSPNLCVPLLFLLLFGVLIAFGFL